MSEMPIPIVSDLDVQELLRFYRSRGGWQQEDRRTREGRAQTRALEQGWIEPARQGLGYRITPSGARVAGAD
jgi:hypothetical protein